MIRKRGKKGKTRSGREEGGGERVKKKREHFDLN